ncbi:L-2-hydroxyglutarate oxidase [Salisaeta longa]|uniref:L-2-hydroxyglutarate oxidase n=1 Tax=Salisaeta longa TaxID=503170 RepID=UPI0003B75A2F|nr:L-2-hydroxyglutarate oxidase [Salisaeta longa]
MSTYDVAIIGGGIVGLATAYRLTQRAPDASVVVLEKESRVAAHQTGRNSGVIHAGLSYTPGSLKAKNCREGRRMLVEFCEREGVAYDLCGKVIVATREEELPILQRLEATGRQNKIAFERIGPERLREIEPHTRGLAALHVPNEGIVDYTGMSEALARIIREAGHDILLNTAVRTLHTARTGVTLQTTAGDVQARYVVNCAGLYADRIAQMSGQDPEAKVVPFRGEYYQLVPERRHLCNTLIYPVPDPAYPFLGVHFTQMIDGRVECGPSAVLAFAREGYRLTDVNWPELWDILTYPGFWRLSATHWQKGLMELVQSLSKRYYVHKARHLIPEVTVDDFEPAPSGVRAQALHPDGTLEDDFWIKTTDRVVNVINAASPAATASLSIGQLIVTRYLEQRLSSVTATAA